MVAIEHRKSGQLDGQAVARVVDRPKDLNAAPGFLRRDRARDLIVRIEVHLGRDLSPGQGGRGGADRGGQDPGVVRGDGDDLRQASGRLGRLPLDEARRQQLTVEILRAALGWISEGSEGEPRARIAGDGLILGCEPNERSLRLGLERGYRALARLTSDRSRRIELVDMANAVRPKTMVVTVGRAGGR